MAKYLFIAVLIVFSAFFSGSEIAYSSANILRLRRIAQERGKLVDKAALYVSLHYDSALTSILIGNNLVNIAASSIATVLAMELMGDRGAWVATAVMTVLILIFGEILPKVVASQTVYAFARLVALPLRVVMVVLAPVGKLIMAIVRGVARIWEHRIPKGPTVTEDDLETIIETAEDEGVMDEDRCDLLQSALDFDGVLAHEVLTPRVDMVAVDIEDDPQDILKEIMDAPYSRIPVYEGSIDSVIGILHMNRLLKSLADHQELNIRQHLMPVYFVHKTMPLDDVLSVMKLNKCHMVIVTDEYGGTMGCLTMEDVLEQLVGDIWDESDEIEEELVRIDDTHYDAAGYMRIYDLFYELDIDDRDFDDDNTTLGGWAIEMIGGYPRKGDSFTYKNLEFTVKKMINMRVVLLGITVNPPQQEEAV